MRVFSVGFIGSDCTCRSGLRIRDATPSTSVKPTTTRATTRTTRRDASTRQFYFFFFFFLSPHLVVVTECFVEQGKSVVDVLGDSYRIVLRRLKLAEHLDPFPGGRLRRLSGKLGPSHVHCSQRQTSTSERNSASILASDFCDHGRETRGAPGLSRVTL